MAETISTQAVVAKAPAKPISLKSFLNIEKSLLTRKVTTDLIGSPIKFLIMGVGSEEQEVVKKDGTLSVDDDGVIMMKKIYNTDMCSALAIANKENAQMRADGIAAAEAGDLQRSYDLLQGYLRKITISFNLLLSNDKSKAIANAIAQKDRTNAEGNIEYVKTDNGHLLTIDTRSFSIVKAFSFGATMYVPNDNVVSTKKAEEVIKEDAKV